METQSFNFWGELLVWLFFSLSWPKIFLQISPTNWQVLFSTFQEKHKKPGIKRKNIGTPLYVTFTIYFIEV